MPFYSTLGLDFGDICTQYSIQDDILISGAGNIGSGSFTISTRTVPPYLIMSWLQWSFHLNAPTKGKNSEKPASLWKNENWLLSFDSSVCGYHSSISMFSLFCCAPPDTNENVPWDVNWFWMNDLLHWFTPGAVIYFSPVSFLDWSERPFFKPKCFFKTGCVQIFRAEFNTTYLICLRSPRFSSWESLMRYLLFIGLYSVVWGWISRPLNSTQS